MINLFLKFSNEKYVVAIHLEVLFLIIIYIYIFQGYYIYFLNLQIKYVYMVKIHHFILDYFPRKKFLCCAEYSVAHVFFHFDANNFQDF